MQDTVLVAEAVVPVVASDGGSDVWHMNRIHIYMNEVPSNY